MVYQWDHLHLVFRMSRPLAQGSPNVYVNGRPLGRVNDSHSCGIKVASGAAAKHILMGD